MTFTFDVSGGFTDLARVRFAIGDTDSTAPMFTDEVINALITEAGSWKKAVIAAIQNLIAQLAATPDFQADWLKVDSSKALGMYQALLKEKKMEYGLAVVATARPVYRADSHATEAPDYSDGI